jgi:hypothetical protein
MGINPAVRRAEPSGKLRACPEPAEGTGLLKHGSEARSWFDRCTG